LKSFKEYVKEAPISPDLSSPEDRNQISQRARQDLSDLLSGEERSGLLKSLDRDRMPGNPVIRNDSPTTDHNTPEIDPEKNHHRRLLSPQHGSGRFQIGSEDAGL
jgi:hypothetical protein